jgi:RNA polymerase sigma-70 factor (ECF subfamily)
VSETAPEDLVTARVDASRRLEVIASALAELTEDERDVLLLSSWAHLEPAEIAEILSVPASTVRSRLHRTRTRLRTLLLDSENLQQASGEN